MALAFLGFLLMFHKQLVLLFSQLAVVVLQMLLVALKVKQFLDAFVFLLQVLPQLHQFALVLLVFAE